MYRIFLSKAYKKSLKRVSRARGFDQAVLFSVVDTLAAGKQLAREYHDHQLTGDMKIYRECHLQNDLLLVYKIEKQRLVLSLIDIGTHSSIF